MNEYTEVLCVGGPHDGVTMSVSKMLDCIHFCRPPEFSVAKPISSEPMEILEYKIMWPIKTAYYRGDV